MAKRDAAFPSKYLKASDLNSESITLTIASAAIETLKNHKGEETQKVVVAFRKMRKTLPLNMTNFDAIVDVTGEDDSDNWAGHTVELYPSEVQVGSKMVDCIRIRTPEQPELAARQKQKAATAKSSAALESEDDFRDKNFDFLRLRILSQLSAQAEATSANNH